MSALRPSCGAMAAWEGMPWKSNVSQSEASAGCASRSRSKGWNIIAASTPSNTPASIIEILPPPPSSAGVPEEHDLAARRLRRRAPPRRTRRPPPRR